MNTQNLENILFLDIETVPLVYQYSKLDKESKELWDKKWQYNKDVSSEKQYEKSGIYAEFAKVVCIGLGYYHSGKFRVKCLQSTDEKNVLTQFAELLEQHFNSPTAVLCAHNGKEFDFPFLCRRFVINSIPLPKILNIQGKKPWEINHLDTMEMWKFGDYKNYTSLNLLAHVFQIPSPKDEMDGSMVASAFYEKNALDKIAEYCMKDVITLARVFGRFTNLRKLEDKDIIFV
ncbi:MAG: 3'-5' exonuclease [Sphingobacteriaceae bacterium]|nr:3'-5' exonuclease [Sphingobacteriaceae bacterium]